MTNFKDEQHAILQDVLRVARELGRVPTRDEYLKMGVTTNWALCKAFGSYTHLLHASGLSQQAVKQSPAEKKFEREKEKYDFKKLICDKYEKEIKPYHGKFDRLKKDIFSIASITDSHSQFWDEFTWSVFFDYIEAAQPDLIILGGDNLEFYGISRHNKNPQRAMEMQNEIDFVRKKKLEEVRRRCPKAQIDYHLGNHEARLFAYLCNNSPALSSLRCLEFNNLLGLDDLEINLIGRESFVFRTKMEDNFKVYRGLWAWTHGTDCSVFPSRKELEKHGVSGASGHVHRHTAISRRDVFGFKSWMSVGAACTLQTGGEYIHNLINWENGWLLTFVTAKQVIQQHISTEGGFACVGGVFYKDKKLLKSF